MYRPYLQACNKRLIDSLDCSPKIRKREETKQHQHEQHLRRPKLGQHEARSAAMAGDATREKNVFTLKLSIKLGSVPIKPIPRGGAHCQLPLPEMATEETLSVPSPYVFTP